MDPNFNKRVLQMQAPLVAHEEPARTNHQMGYMFFNIKRNIF